MSRLHPRFWPDHARAAAAHPRTPDLASIALVAVLGWQLADLSWAMLPAPASATPAAPSPGTPTETHSAGQPRAAAKLAALHLFGEAAPPEQVEATPDTGADAPETELNLTLKGLYAPGTGRGFAIIAAGNGSEDVYSVGDTIAGGARISAIFADRVVLRRNGRAETLRLANVEVAPAEPEGRVADAGERGVASDEDAIARRAGELRTQLTENPLELARMVRFQPYVEDGELVGYRIQPRAAEAELLQDLGIQPTDVITRINEFSLSDPQQANQALQALRDARMINITLLRDGRSQRMSIPIGNPG